jgi:hypothetical protein
MHMFVLNNLSDHISKWMLCEKVMLVLINTAQQ